MAADRRGQDIESSAGTPDTENLVRARISRADRDVERLTRRGCFSTGGPSEAAGPASDQRRVLPPLEAMLRPCGRTWATARERLAAKSTGGTNKPFGPIAVGGRVLVEGDGRATGSHGDRAEDGQTPCIDSRCGPWSGHGCPRDGIPGAEQSGAGWDGALVEREAPMPISGQQPGRDQAINLRYAQASCARLRRHQVRTSGLGCT